MMFASWVLSRVGSSHRWVASRRKFCRPTVDPIPKSERSVDGLCNARDHPLLYTQAQSSHSRPILTRLVSPVVAWLCAVRDRRPGEAMDEQGGSLQQPAGDLQLPR